MILTVPTAEARGGGYFYGSSLAFLRKQKKEDMNFHTHSEKLPSQQDLEHLAPLISYHNHSALLLGKYRFIVLTTQMIPSHFRLGFSASVTTQYQITLIHQIYSHLLIHLYQVTTA